MTSCSPHGVIALPKAIQAVHIVVCGEVLLATHTHCLLLNTHLVLVIYTCVIYRERGEKEDEREEEREEGRSEGGGRKQRGGEGEREGGREEEGEQKRWKRRGRGG